MSLTTPHDVAVPEQARPFPDLPEVVGRARVFRSSDAGGLPRGIRDLRGRVTACRWADDATLEVEVTWIEEPALAETLRLLQEGVAKLVLSLNVIARRRGREVDVNRSGYAYGVEQLISAEVLIAPAR